MNADVLGHIMSFLDRPGDWRSAAAAMEVCKAWRSAAAPMLHTHLLARITSLKRRNKELEKKYYNTQAILMWL